MEYIMSLYLVEGKVEMEIGWEETNKQTKNIFLKAL